MLNVKKVAALTLTIGVATASLSTIAMQGSVLQTTEAAAKVKTSKETRKGVFTINREVKRTVSCTNVKKTGLKTIRAEIKIHYIQYADIERTKKVKTVKNKKQVSYTPWTVKKVLDRSVEFPLPKAGYANGSQAVLKPANKNYTVFSAFSHNNGKNLPGKTVPIHLNLFSKKANVGYCVTKVALPKIDSKKVIKVVTGFKN